MTRQPQTVMDDAYLYIRPIISRMYRLKYQRIGCGQLLEKYVYSYLEVNHQSIQIQIKLILYLLKNVI